MAGEGGDGSTARSEGFFSARQPGSLGGGGWWRWQDREDRGPGSLGGFFPWRLVVVVTAPRGASVSLGLASLPKEQGAGMDIHSWITW